MNEGIGIGQVNPNAKNNALAVTCAGATAVGSTDTVVVRYTAAMVTDPGGCFGLAEAAATGSIFTVRRSGLYCLEAFAGLAAGGALALGISLNAAAAGALTGPPLDFAAVDAGAGSEGVIACAVDNSAAGEDTVRLFCSRTLYLSVGDTLRILVTAGVTLDAANSRAFFTPLALD